MKMYDCVPGLEFDESLDFQSITGLVPRRDALRAAVDAYVWLVLDQFLPSRHAVRGRKTFFADRKGMGLAVQGWGGLSVLTDR